MHALNPGAPRHMSSTCPVRPGSPTPTPTPTSEASRPSDLNDGDARTACDFSESEAPPPSEALRVSARSRAGSEASPSWPLRHFAQTGGGRERLCAGCASSLAQKAIKTDPNGRYFQRPSPINQIHPVICKWSTRVDAAIHCYTPRTASRRRTSRLRRVAGQVGEGTEKTPSTSISMYRVHKCRSVSKPGLFDGSSGFDDGVS